uniref:Uncharacterized protein n=1 Tax=Octopus bimaculoides TaxID=37653 RepID=A0A0L8HXR8_OCTBM
MRIIDCISYWIVGKIATLDEEAEDFTAMLKKQYLLRSSAVHVAHFPYCSKSFEQKTSSKLLASHAQ